LRRRELMSRHERGRNRIADVILSRVARTTSDLQQRAVIPNQEDRQFRTMLPLMIDTFDISVGEELENSRIESGHSPLERSAHVGKRLGGLDPDVMCSTVTLRLATVGNDGSASLAAVMDLAFPVHTERDWVRSFR
jgi:hypothetical protein